MKKVNAFDLIYFGGTNIILLCNIYVYKYIPLRNSFCESSSEDLLTLPLFLKIHLYFTDAQPQPPHFSDLWPKTNSSRSKSLPLRQSNILCSINIFHFCFLCENFFQNYFNRYFLWPPQLPHAKRDRVVFHSFLYWTHLLFDIYVHCTSLQSSIEFSKKKFDIYVLSCSKSFLTLSLTCEHTRVSVCCTFRLQIHIFWVIAFSSSTTSILESEFFFPLDFLA